MREFLSHSIFKSQFHPQRMNLASIHMYPKYCLTQNTNKQMLLLFLSFGFAVTNAYHTYRLATTNGPFSEKNYIQNVQHVYSYTIIQGSSLIKYSLLMYRRLNTGGTVWFFLAVFKMMRTKRVQVGAGGAQGDTDRSTSSFSDEEGDMGMSSSSSSEHLAADRDEHLQLCDPVLWPPVFPSFLCFTLRFWNQIFTCFSDKFRYVAISMRLSLDRYMLEVNSLSSSKSCVLVKAVRMRLLL